MLNGKSSNGFNSKKNDLVAEETKILNEIGFDLDSYPNFYDIVEIFMAQGILFTADSYNNQPIDQEKYVNMIEKYTDFFMLLSLQDYKLVNTNQYLIACSVTSAARKHCNIEPIWPKELE